MHQTTVRFAPELWEALEAECSRAGISVAQYLREAALTRLVYAAGRRGDDEFELALDLVASVQPLPAQAGHQQAEVLETMAAPARDAKSAHERALREGWEATALAAQGRLARRRARELRERAARFRER